MVWILTHSVRYYNLIVSPGWRFYMNRSRYGRKAEERVAKALRSRGAKVKVSPGNRGAADMKAIFPVVFLSKRWIG